MVVLSGSVGLGGRNNEQDVALVQVMLKNTKGLGSFFDDAPIGAYGTDLGKNIAAYQVKKGLVQQGKNENDIGIIKPFGETFKALQSDLKSDFRDLQVFFPKQFYPIFIVRKKPLAGKPNIPKHSDLRLSNLYASRIQTFLKKMIVEFEVVSRDISPEGQFCLVLRSKDKFYDPNSNKVVDGPTGAFVELLLRKQPIKDWHLSVLPDRSILFKSTKNKFFSRTRPLNQSDRAHLEYWGIPSSRERKADAYHDKLLAAVVKPWRNITPVSQSGRLFVPKNTVSGSDRHNSSQAAQALASYGDYSKNVKIAYDEILKQQIRGGPREPLVLLYVGGEFQILVGISARIGLLFDPNTQKEYVYIKLKIELAAAVAFGFEGGVKTLSQDIEELLHSKGPTFGASFSNVIDLGPLSIKLNFSSSSLKLPPDVKWKGLSNIPTNLLGFDAFDISENSIKLSNNKSEVGGLKTGELLSQSADIDTGQRLHRGSKSSQEGFVEQREKYVRSKNVVTSAKRAATKLEYSFLEVDTGPVKFELALKPKVSGKVKIEFGPEIHGEHTFVFPADVDFGWIEDGIYSALRRWLPET